MRLHVGGVEVDWGLELGCDLRVMGLGFRMSPQHRKE